MRRIRTLLLFALAVGTAAAPALAQDFQRPEGWMTRFDRPGMTEADLEMFVEMPPGWHVTTGPAGIFWSPSNTASGDFRLEMEVFLFDPAGRREAFGLFAGGRDLQGPDQAYTYFLLRDGGEFIIKRREGEDAPTVRPWTANEAILGYADRGEEVSVKNVLALEAEGDTVRFFVNGEEVAAIPRGDVPVDGIYGFRVNHMLNLHISKLAVEPLG
jgi:hypothetical protein